MNRALEQLNEKQRSKEINLNTLKKGIPGAKLKHVQFAIEKYEAILAFMASRQHYNKPIQKNIAQML
ncbi:hypothetical protein [Legionella hackeliae]|uniref:hypothetical protein n=1 Tax=Legionella hackeliae TaxID=449 RepID=UPI000E1FD84F|nr:hypothetical protein [Legionella hackeliae]